MRIGKGNSMKGVPMRQTLRKFGMALIAFIVGAATLVGGTVTAQAATNSGPGYWFNPFREGPVFAGKHGVGLGVIGMKDGLPVYCIESGIPAGSLDGNWQPADDMNSRIGATLVDRNKGDMSDMTQAAVQYAIHDHLDQGSSSWSVYKRQSLEGANMADVANRAAQLWNDAAQNVPTNGTVDYRYTQSQREGDIRVFIKNSAGNYVQGVPWKVQLKGPVALNGPDSGVTGNGETVIHWRATGNGQAFAKVVFNASSAKKMASAAQDMFMPGDPRTLSSNEVQFRVQLSFQPTVSTQVSSKQLARGEPVKDKVTSGLSGDAPWVPGTSVPAHGYYFQSKTPIDSIPQTGGIENPENVDSYLARVKQRYGEPVATADTVFTGQNQTHEVTGQARGRQYVNPEDGLFGNWVWIIRKSDAGAAQGNIKADYIHTAGQVPESSVHQIQTSVWSEVAEPHAMTGADIRDVIHVTGLPKDLGDFKGGNGFGADERNATVQVWWSGATGADEGVKEADMRFMPSTPQAPTPDANHKLLQTLTYDLRKLIDLEGNTYHQRLDIRVAGGNAGSPLADGSHVSIPGTKTGYYTFVFSYPGCDRVAKYTSAYNDQFESTFVTKEKATIDLTSNTNPDSVLVGESFSDVAHIVGDLNITQGAYVTFDAYQPVVGKPDPSVGKILDQDKHVLSADQLATLHQGHSVDVPSSSIQAQSSGTVYWQAALHDANGTIVATHPLGIKSESTVIKGGGTIRSIAQTQGAVGGPAWDIITVADKTNGVGRGNIPAGSIVRVSYYKHEGQAQPVKGQLVGTKEFPVDIAKLGARPGSYSFQANVGTYPAAGQYYWVHQLIGPDGAVIDEGHYGDDSERTPVQEYATDTAKKWLSTNDEQYSTKTIETYDALTQKYYTQWGSDMESKTREGQTMPGTQAQFSIWSHTGDVAQDTKIVDGKPIDLPKVPTNKQEHFEQKIRSETFSLPSSITHGTYYYRARITNSVDAQHLRDIGVASDGLVWEAPQRVQRESFDVIRVTSRASETAWTTDQQHVEEQLIVDGNLPADSKYEVELWSRDATGRAVKKIGSTGVQPIPTAITGHGVIPVSMNAPTEPGGYQFRHKIWSPDQQGGPVEATTAGIILPPDWAPAPDKHAGYQHSELIANTDHDASEQFEMICITTDVTGMTGIHTTVNGEHYLNVTKGAQTNDHAKIEGHVPAGYKLGFRLYKQAPGDDPTQDKQIASIAATDVAEATTVLQSALTNITDPGDYYWQYVFTKADGKPWSPDGEREVVSDKRIKAESFHAVRITTATYQWSSKHGKATDTAIIDGCLPVDATIGFALHEYESTTQAGSLSPVKLSDLGYKPCTNGDSTQQVVSRELSVPQAIDYYWVEHVRLPGDDTDFHRGDERVPHESTRAIDATTQVTPQIMLGMAIHDDTDLQHIQYAQDKDIRDDLKPSLKASWELWKQDTTSDDSAKDKLVTTIDKEGVPLSDGQANASSSDIIPTDVGMYYWRIRISGPDGKLIKYGSARDLAETFRVITAVSHTQRLIQSGTPATDQVTITGPVAPGTMVSWKAWRQQPGDGSADEQVLDYYDPAHGAVIVEGAQARGALTTGKTVITTPHAYKETKPGDSIYWQFSITSPRRDDKNMLMTPTLGKDGVYATDHLTQACPTTLQAPLPGQQENASTPDSKSCVLQPLFTDKARVEDETFNVIKVTTQTKGEAMVGDMIHDTALIEGTVPSSTKYCIAFEYWKQDKGSDVSLDKLETTTDCVPVPAGAHEVQGPEHKAVHAGLHYYRERLLPSEHQDGPPIVYGQPRVPGESVNVKQPPLPVTGTRLAGILLVAMLMVFVLIGIHASAKHSNRIAQHRK